MPRMAEHDYALKSAPKICRPQEKSRKAKYALRDFLKGKIGGDDED